MHSTCTYTYVRALTYARARLWCCSYMSLVYERTNNERISFEVGICVRVCGTGIGRSVCLFRKILSL